MELQCEIFPVHDAIEDVYTILKGLASKKHLELKSTILPDVKTSKQIVSKFNQILYNLLSNAIKFTRKMDTLTSRPGIMDDMLQVSVSDTGIGMKPDDREKVF